MRPYHWFLIAATVDVIIALGAAVVYAAVRGEQGHAAVLCYLFVVTLICVAALRRAE